MRKLILSNILIFFILLLGINIISYAVLQFKDSKQVKSKLNILPNYEEEEFIAYLHDKQRLRLEYRAFEGWAHLPYQGNYISINEEGYRTTINPNETAEKECWFLGGSVMWGYGNQDSTTIPSLFATATDSFKVYNYAEQGFNSRQNLARLVSLYSLGKQSDLVITLDGVNDIISLCYEDTPIPGHSRSEAIKEKLVDYERDGALRMMMLHLKGLCINAFWVNTSQLLSRLRDRLFGREEKFKQIYTCIGDEERMERIADQLIKNWEMMHSLVEQQGGKFIAILQPILGISKGKTDHIQNRLIQNRLEHFQAFYPILQGKIKALNYDWIYDYSTVLDKHADEYIFTDDCHLSANGNQIITDALVKSIQ